MTSRTHNRQGLNDPTTSRRRLLSVRQAAEVLNVGEKAVRACIDRGDLRVHRISRYLRITEADLDDFIDASRVAQRNPLHS